MQLENLNTNKIHKLRKNDFAANQLPMTRDSSDAWWDRWVVIEFPFHFYPPKVFSELTDPELIKWGKTHGHKNA